MPYSSLKKKKKERKAQLISQALRWPIILYVRKSTFLIGYFVKPKYTYLAINATKDKVAVKVDMKYGVIRM